MADMALIGGLANSLNVALGITKAMIGIRDQAMIQEKVLELTSEIMSAQQAGMAAIAAQAELSQRVGDLEKRIMEMEAWLAEKQRYELKDIEVSSFVYALKKSMSEGQPPHWICTRCYEDSKKSILQYLGYGSSGADLRVHRWSCPVCAAIIRARHTIQPTFDSSGADQHANP